jgi:hypothetical protein
MKTNKTKPPSPTTPHTARNSLRRLSALTRQLTAQGKFEDAAAAIDQLFAIAAPRDERSERLLDKARQSYFACQRALARQNQPAAAQAAAELLAETEKLAGYPIQVAVEDDADLSDGSGVNLAWERGCGQHLVLCRREPQELQPYELAAALVRIQTESEAWRANKSRFPSVSRQQKRELLSLFDPLEAQRLAAEGGLRITLNPDPDDIASAPYMLVDARLRQLYPVLRPAQFLSRANAFLDDWQAREDRTGIPPSQRLRERTINALGGLQGLFLDALFGGVTDFSSRCRDLDGFDLSQKLWQHWQTRSLAMQPGDEFAMLDGFAEILGLAGWFGWVSGPSKGDGTPPASPDTAPRG